MTRRAAFLDRIRVVLTVLVMWHHSAIMFGGTGDWYLRNPVDGKLTGILFTLMGSVDQASFMGAFFFLSGYFTPRAFDSRGFARFTLDRLLRLGVPLLVYGFVIGPMTVALSAQFVRGAPFWSLWWRLVCEPMFEIGPLWFAFALLLFNAAFALWRWAVSSPVAAPLGVQPAARLLAFSGPRAGGDRRRHRQTLGAVELGGIAQTVSLRNCPRRVARRAV